MDPHSVTWRRCLDMDDRALRKIVVGLGGRVNGAPRETGFDITAASEVMAIVAVARDPADLRARLGAITVGTTFAGEPVTAEQLGCAGSMAALLTETLKPNLVQTLEGQPALVHCGPFANIAHGNNSLLADRLGLKLADYVVTESGFGAEMGFEKFVDIVCRTGGIAPSGVVLVATVQALKHHGGDPDGGVQALERGAANLAANLAIVREVGLEPVVAVNRHPGRHDRRAPRAAQARARSRRARRGGQRRLPHRRRRRGRAGRGRRRRDRASAAGPLPLRGRGPARAETRGRSRRAPTAPPGSSSPRWLHDKPRNSSSGLGHLPVCIAKTHLSLSHDPALLNAPRGFTFPVRELRAYTGAGWVVASAARCRRCPACPPTRPRRGSTSTPTAASSACADASVPETRWAAALAARSALLLVGLFALAQLVPMAFTPTRLCRRSPGGTLPQTRALACARASMPQQRDEMALDSNVAPASWLVQRDVDSGRSTLNFSEWNRPQEGGDAVEAARGGGMPPWYYVILHANAKLSANEKEAPEAGCRRRSPGRRRRAAAAGSRCSRVIPSLAFRP